MNILYYDENIGYEHLNDLWKHLKDTYPEDTLLFLPNTVQLLIDASAEQLFDVGDKISVALEKIKEERPEEYKKAYDNRMVTIRDKQWREVVNKQIEAHNKKKK
jgi:5'-deoxynucleotidase YfbR-like HD superfamily hydrolase